MAKLYLTLENKVLKEFDLAQEVVTIGRLPDNQVQIDNLAVSGHHAKIYREGDHYVIEDISSLNGTYVNNHRISKAIVKNEDQVLVGKHTLVFKDEYDEDAPAAQAAANPVPPVATAGAAVVLDNKKAKEMVPQTAAGAAAVAAPAPVVERIAILTVLQGRTDQSKYVLSSKLNVIGKSPMASIKLKGWFAPKVAGVINHRDHKYFIAASEKDLKVKVNDAQISGQRELQEGDIVEVAGVKMTFSFAE